MLYIAAGIQNYTGSYVFFFTEKSIKEGYLISFVLNFLVKISINNSIVRVQEVSEIVKSKIPSRGD